MLLFTSFDCNNHSVMQVELSKEVNALRGGWTLTDEGARFWAQLVWLQSSDVFPMIGEAGTIFFPQPIKAIKVITLPNPIIWNIQFNHHSVTFKWIKQHLFPFSRGSVIDWKGTKLLYVRNHDIWYIYLNFLIYKIESVTFIISHGRAF